MTVSEEVVATVEQLTAMVAAKVALDDFEPDSPLDVRGIIEAFSAAQDARVRSNRTETETEMDCGQQGAIATILAELTAAVEANAAVADAQDAAAPLDVRGIIAAYTDAKADATADDLETPVGVQDIIDADEAGADLRDEQTKHRLQMRARIDDAQGYASSDTLQGSPSHLVALANIMDGAVQDAHEPLPATASRLRATELVFSSDVTGDDISDMLEAIVAQDAAGAIVELTTGCYALVQMYHLWRMIPSEASDTLHPFVDYDTEACHRWLLQTGMQGAPTLPPLELGTLTRAFIVPYGIKTPGEVMAKHANNGQCSARLHVTIADGRVKQMIHCGQMVHADEARRSSFLRLTITHAGSEWKVHSYRPLEGGFMLVPDPWMPSRELTLVGPTTVALAEPHDTYTGPRYKRRDRVAVPGVADVIEARATAPRPRTGRGDVFNAKDELNERFMYLSHRAVANLRRESAPGAEALNEALVRELHMVGRTVDTECALLTALVPRSDPDYDRKIETVVGEFEEMVAKCMNHYIDATATVLGAAEAEPSDPPSDAPVGPVSESTEPDGTVMRLWEDPVHAAVVYPHAPFVVGTAGELLVDGNRVAQCALDSSTGLRRFMITVDEAHRGRGYGCRLGKFTIDHAMSDDRTVEVDMWMTTGFLANPRAENIRRMRRIVAHCCIDGRYHQFESPTLLIVKKKTQGRTARKRVPKRHFGE